MFTLLSGQRHQMFPLLSFLSNKSHTACFSIMYTTLQSPCPYFDYSPMASSNETPVPGTSSMMIRIVITAAPKGREREVQLLKRLLSAMSLVPFWHQLYLSKSVSFSKLGMTRHNHRSHCLWPAPTVLKRVSARPSQWDTAMAEHNCPSWPDDSALCQDLQSRQQCPPTFMAIHGLTNHNHLPWPELLHSAV